MSNLNSSVSDSDLVDLFCAIGAIRDAKLGAEEGTAVITFVKRAAAMAAITKYNGRELDKQKIIGNLNEYIQTVNCWFSWFTSSYGFTSQKTISMAK